MFHKLAAVAVFSALFGQVMSHGVVISPPIRKPGAAFQANCGDQIFNNVNSDGAGNIQALEQNKQAATFNADLCNLNLCKGLQFADVNTADIQTYTPGQVVPIVVDIRAPHTGTANVSIVDTTTNTVIGSPMVTFDVYASNSVPIQADQTHFNITIPDLGGKCAKAGNCVVQWWWDARSIDQTYESCIDFTMSGSGPAPATSNTAAPTTTAVATSTASPTASTQPTTTEVVEPTTTAEPAATSSSAAPAETTSPCGMKVQPREVRRNAKWARCGGFGWTDSSACPEGLKCHAYNAVSSPQCGITVGLMFWAIVLLCVHLGSEPSAHVP
ncbi:hypothetical protein FRC10_011869 [Ceratobasidium sp. 414]|nr:hypothetical protein FRC10_011869 [Ceratobasidium sp. 414]